MSGKRIEELFAYVAEETDGEGVVAFQGPGGVWLPLVGADVARKDSLRAMAQHIADESGKRIRLLRFSVREELVVIEPKGRGLAS